MKKITMAVLGFGQRGSVFSDVSKSFPDEVELKVVCEVDTSKHNMIKETYGIKPSFLFSDYSTFLSKGKLADILVISTLDQDHYHQAMLALDMGYHILLEKPIALSKREILEIKDKANKLNLKIAVAHVLRYTHFYSKIKELVENDAIGEIVTLHQTENVGYLHYAHSYVRGNWHNSEKSSPMILAKSCHDLDIIRYLIGNRVSKINSFGNLFYFKEKNKPIGAAKNCIDCKVDCIFNAINYYKDNKDWMKFFTQKQDVLKVFSDRTLDYGKCVYQMDNDVVDHQTVNMTFENGQTASLTMTAFSKETHRYIEIKGTKGEIIGDLESNLITVLPFGKPNYEIDINKLTTDFSFHSGGDKRLLIDFVRAVRDNTAFLTDINYSVESHYLAFDAEASRLDDGNVINAKDHWGDYDRKK